MKNPEADCHKVLTIMLAFKLKPIRLLPGTPAVLSFFTTLAAQLTQ